MPLGRRRQPQSKLNKERVERLLQAENQVVSVETAKMIREVSEGRQETIGEMPEKDLSGVVSLSHRQLHGEVANHSNHRQHGGSLSSHRQHGATRGPAGHCNNLLGTQHGKGHKVEKRAILQNDEANRI